jgi:AcrR family transcriptional regulator
MSNESIRPEGPSATPSGGGGERTRIVEAFMALLAEQPFEQIGLGDVAARAGVTLAQLRSTFPSTFSILAAHVVQIDQAVLASGEGDMAEEPVRERLFDVLMRRLEALTPYKEAVRSLMRSSARHPALALGLNRLGVRSQQWMLTAADIKVAGPKGAMRAQALAVLFAGVLWTWIDDQDPGLARTMAVLDRELLRAERLSGMLDDLCAIPAALCRPGGWRARRTSQRQPSGDAPAAA